MDISKIKTKRIDGLDDELRKIVQPGDICYSLRNEKEGWILCDGRAVSRTDYSDLFEAIGTQYGEGDGTTTFNVPNYRGKFLQMVSDSQTVGQEIEAGLPNIIGQTSGDTQWSNYGIVGTNGAITVSGSGGWSTGTGINYGGSLLSFNASLSSSIYGNSETVQPPAFTVNYFIKY